LELAGDKWKPSQTLFQKHPSFRHIDPVARLKRLIILTFSKRSIRNCGNRIRQSSLLLWKC
jgi:hypothetical protein